MKLKKILISFLLFFCLDLLFWKVVWSDERSIWSSLSASLFFSLIWLIPVKTKAQLDEQFLRESVLVLLPDEKLSFGTIANQIDGNEVIGGKLFLTDRRVVFVSNKPRHQNSYQDFERAQIASVQRHTEFPKAIVIVTLENSMQAFNVDRHEEWMKALA